MATNPATFSRLVPVNPIESPQPAVLFSLPLTSFFVTPFPFFSILLSLLLSLGSFDIVSTCEYKHPIRARLQFNGLRYSFAEKRPFWPSRKGWRWLNDIGDPIKPCLNRDVCPVDPSRFKAPTSEGRILRHNSARSIRTQYSKPKPRPLPYFRRLGLFPQHDNHPIAQGKNAFIIQRYIAAELPEMVIAHH